MQRFSSTCVYVVCRRRFGWSKHQRIAARVFDLGTMLKKAAKEWTSS